MESNQPTSTAQECLPTTTSPTEEISRDINLLASKTRSIVSGSPELDHFRLELSALSRSLTEAVENGKVTKWDQKQLESQLKTIRDFTASTQGDFSQQKIGSPSTKPKFAFKGRNKPTKLSTPSPSRVVDEPARTSPQLPPSKNDSGTVRLSSRKKEWLTVSELPDLNTPKISHEQQDDQSRQLGWLALSDLEDCVVDLTRTADQKRALTASLHINRLVNTCVLVDAEGGSIMLTGLEKCFVIVRCHQFRAHSSSNCTFLIDTTSVPIIENCESLCFRRILFSPTSGSASSAAPSLQVKDFDDPLSLQGVDIGDVSTASGGRNWQLIEDTNLSVALKEIGAMVKLNGRVESRESNEREASLLDKIKRMVSLD